MSEAYIKNILTLMVVLFCYADQCAGPLHLLEFVIIIPSYNNEEYYFRNLESVVHQKVDAPFEIVYINDCSTDRTGMLVDAYVKERHLEDKVKVIHNSQRVGNALGNLYTAIHECADHKIIVTVDGDDFLAHDRVLARLQQEYADPNVWMTYGQFMYYPQNSLGFCAELPSGLWKQTVLDSTIRSLL